MKKHPVKPNAQNAVISPRREHARGISGENDGYGPVEAFFKMLLKRNFRMVKGKGQLIACCIVIQLKRSFS